MAIDLHPQTTSCFDSIISMAIKKKSWVLIAKSPCARGWPAEGEILAGMEPRLHVA